MAEFITPASTPSHLKPTRRNTQYCYGNILHFFVRTNSGGRVLPTEDQLVAWLTAQPTKESQPWVGLGMNPHAAIKHIVDFGRKLEASDRLRYEHRGEVEYTVWNKAVIDLVQDAEAREHMTKRIDWPQGSERFGHIASDALAEHRVEDPQSLVSRVVERIFPAQIEAPASVRDLNSPSRPMARSSSPRDTSVGTLHPQDDQESMQSGFNFLSLSENAAAIALDVNGLGTQRELWEAQVAEITRLGIDRKKELHTARTAFEEEKIRWQVDCAHSEDLLVGRRRQLDDDRAKLERDLKELENMRDEFEGEKEEYRRSTEATERAIEAKQQLLAVHTRNLGIVRAELDAEQADLDEQKGQIRTMKDQQLATAETLEKRKRELATWIQSQRIIEQQLGDWRAALLQREKELKDIASKM